MTDVSITPANVLASGDARVSHGHKAGGTITAGMALYKEASTGKYKAADADSGTEEVKNASAIALNGASDGQPLSILTKGKITIGGTVVAGTVYALSAANPGGIAPLSDITTDDDVIIVGVATTAAIIDVDFNNTGVTL
ncbi:hypothetical protein [Methyloceanibacter caenitepidi]|uniref:Phage protein n=1 Tax=Methyloceanibacter caenitepidi TaxID=1384459 RepID=A0A0A8K699_9HYPH|nr:hypothetical protein [Methyloceanibacter caenitepidi]BAQ18306.1 phage protein [Methyloceanibacter caenitepidi]